MVTTDAVQITINVVDGNSGAVVSQVTKNLDSLGQAGASTGARMRKGMAEAGVGARESVEKIRLPLEELGVRLPRAFVSLIAQSKTAQAAIGAVGSALVGIGTIQIGALIFEQVIGAAEKFWHNVLDVNAAMKDYQEEADKAKEKDFTNTRSIETTILRIHEATEAMRAFKAEAEQHSDARLNIGKQDWIGVTLNALGPLGGAAEFTRESAWSHDAQANQMEKQRQIDELSRGRLAEQKHQENLGQIDVRRSIDERLQGEAKINALHQDRLNALREEARFNDEMEGIYGNPVPQRSLSNTPIGKGGVHGFIASIHEPSQAEQKENADTETQKSNLRREQAQELRRIHEEALESGLRGSELYHAQEAAAIEDLKQKGLASLAAVNDVRTKFHNEEMRRLEEQRIATEKIERTAAASGLSGVAKIQAEGTNRIADIRDVNFDDADSQGHSALADRQRKAAAQQTDSEILQLEQGFTDRVKELSDESAEHQIGGFAKIRAEGQKQIDALMKDYQRAYGTNVNAPEYKAHLGQLNQGTAAINSIAGQDSADLARRNAEETSQIESEARAKFLSSEKNQTAAIETEYEQRLQKFQEWKTQELASDQLSAQERADINDQFNRRVIAADEIRDAQLIDAARQAREKMAGEFTSLFRSLDHPAEAFKNLGEKAAGQAAAAMVQRMQQHVDSKKAVDGTGLFGGKFGTALSTIGLNPGYSGALSGEHLGMPKGTGALGAHAAAPESSSKMISLASAEIRIASANLNIAGFSPSSFTGTASSVSGAGSVAGIPGGSTSLMSLGGYSSSSGTASAGDVGFPGSSGTSPATSFAAGPGVAAPQGTRASGAMNDLGQGASLLKQGLSTFSGKGNAGAGGIDIASGGRSGADQIPLQSLKNFDVNKMAHGPGGMLNGGGFGANAAGAATGALGLFGAVEGTGGLGGTLSGAMSGMQLGMSLGGPLGAAIGAAGGAVLGALGLGGREKARVYYLKTVLPRITADVDGLQNGTMEYTSAYSDLQSLDAEAHKALDAMGPAGHSYYWGTVIGKIHEAEGKLTAEQRAGRSEYTPGIAQYSAGTDFVPQTGQYRLHRGESVLTAEETESQSQPVAGGATPTRMAADTQSSWGGDIHIHAIDAKGAHQWIMNNKHSFRSAVNASYAENSGGADA